MPNPHPHLFPEPRLAVGAWLLKNRRASSAIDISDGLSTDLDHLCEESGLTATDRCVCDSDSSDSHSALQAAIVTRHCSFALHGGEDYELLFTASPKMHVPRRIAGVPITCIGEMRADKSRTPRVQLVESN